MMRRRLVRLGCLALAPGLVSGCLLWPARRSFNNDVAELDTQVASLTRRVGALEAGTPAPVASVAGDTAFAAEGGAGAIALPRPGIRWPGLPQKEAFVKLLRGLTNVLTGWVELPKRVRETSNASGAMAGFTYGIARGLGYGFVRTLGGAYEVVTFPFPAPPDYRPVMRPAYIFTCEER